jgi:iron complex transport system substrate-binding protein
MSPRPPSLQARHGGARLRAPIVVVALLGILGSACSATPTPSPSVTVPASPTATPVASPYPESITDDTGRAVTIASRPERIVSLAPSNTEIVCALGACDRLVGVTDFDDYPAQVTALPKVVISATVDVEKVVAARPDLILAAGNGLTPDTVIAQLRGLGYPVLTLYPQSLDGVYADIRMVGAALDAVRSATETVAGMQARVAAVVQAVAGASRPRTFYEVSVYQGTIYTAGKGSFLASLIELAGGDPVTGDARSTAIGLEDLVAADPQLILLGDASYDPSLTDAKTALQTIAKRPGWGGMTAAETGRVVPFLEDEVTTRPGPRIVDGLVALARAIHPDRFGA